MNPGLPEQLANDTIRADTGKFTGLFFAQFDNSFLVLSNLKGAKERKGWTMINLPDEETKVVPKKSRMGADTVPDTINAVVEIKRGKNVGHTFKITEKVTTIGRSGDVNIKLDDETLSRCHAAITYSNMEFRIKDLDSANGTILNGSEVSEYALRNNDKVIVGETMLQFQIERV
jgi:hypothetical protein